MRLTLPAALWLAGGCQSAPPRAPEPVASPVSPGQRLFIGEPAPLRVDEAPPAPLEEAPPRCAADDTPIPGQWDWSGRWQWLPPTCALLQPGFAFAPPRYADGIYRRGFIGPAAVTETVEAPLELPSSARRPVTLAPQPGAVLRSAEEIRDAKRQLDERDFRERELHLRELEMRCRISPNAPGCPGSSPRPATRGKDDLRRRDNEMDKAGVQRDPVQRPASPAQR